jgi:hypothetical protein
MLQTHHVVKIALVMLCVASNSCQSISKPAPLESSSVIAPLNVYESPQDRSLAIKYYSNLENIYNSIRSHFNPNKLEFFMISGICFRRLQMEKTFDLYLSLNTKSPQIFREDETTFEQRAAAIFKSYIKQLLVIAAQEKAILNDEVVTGIMVNNRWQIETIINPQYQSVSFEQLTFVAPKKEINDYVNHLITDQELLHRSILIALQNGETPRIITLSLEEAQDS